MLKKIIGLFCVCSIVAVSFGLLAVRAENNGYINNADVCPKWVDVTDPSISVDAEGAPSWAKNIIIAHADVWKRSTDGTLMGMMPIVEHLRETGINCLWLSPLGQHDGNPYLNYGWHTIDPHYTGTDDYQKGFEVLGQFIAECHKRNIRVILDWTSWALNPNSDLVKNHPDFFTGKEDNGGLTLNWENPDLVSFYADTVVDICVRVNADGCRFDCEPRYSGYLPNEQIKSRLAGMGRKMLFMSEVANERMGAYDIEQYGVNPLDFSTTYPFAGFVEKYNVVDAVKTGSVLGSHADILNGEGGSHHYYTVQLCCHDSLDYAAHGNPLVIGYQALFTPFIPLWETGEEFNNPFVVQGYTLFSNPLNFKYKDINRDFYETVKKLIRIRWQYADLFENSTESCIQDANICKVIADGGEEVQPYARYRDHRAVIVLPNMRSDRKTDFKVYTPFEDAKLSGYRHYTVTDLNTGKEIASGTAKEIACFKATVAYRSHGLYLVTGQDKIPVKETSSGGKKIVYLSETKPTESDGLQSESQEAPAQEPETEPVLRKVKKYKKNQQNDTEFPWVWIVAAVAGAVVIAAGVTTVVIYKKRKR